MMRLEELIQAHCPEGVPWVELGTMLAHRLSPPYMVASTDYKPEYATPVLTAGKTFVLGYTDETEGIYEASPERPVIIFDEFTTVFRWVDFPFKVKSSAMRMLTAMDESYAGLRYLYYAMQGIRYAPREYRAHWLRVYSKFSVPVPPLEVQREIVRILDAFSASETELEGLLAAELAARRKQYEYYRDQLLTFGEDVEWGTLGEMATFNKGFSRKSKWDFGQGNAVYIPYRNMSSNLTVDPEWLEIVDVAPSERRYTVQQGDLLFTASSETADKVGISSVVMELPDRPVYLNGYSFGMRFHEGVPILPEFSKHLFRCRTLRRAITQIANGTIQYNLSIARFREIRIPIPPLTRQREIADVLDPLYSQSQGLMEGLQAELEARRKQYKYYRERLLCFPKPSDVGGAEG